VVGVVAVLFRIRHESWYRYDVPVALGEHVLRLTPRADGIRLLSHRLAVEPLPSSRIQELDALGNSVTRVGFQGTTQSFRVQSELELETLAPPPLALGLPRLPWGRLSAPGGTQVDASVFGFAQSIAQEAGHDPSAVLDHLTHTLFTSFDRKIRHTGDARLAAETLALRQGACRDLTVLFLEACACWGIPGRFVSGYQAQADTPDGQRHLHAWSEVFLPGVGWRGWDATHGMRVGEGHVALCAAPTQAATMPIQGGFVFQGAVVNSTLDHSVRISTGAP
jgi:transglutaminase-like putative cysteine protease